MTVSAGMHLKSNLCVRKPRLTALGQCTYWQSSGRVVYPDRTAFFGDYIRIGGHPTGTLKFESRLSIGASAISQELTHYDAIATENAVLLTQSSKELFQQSRRPFQ
jgi:hypothetical protein